MTMTPDSVTMRERTDGLSVRPPNHIRLTLPAKILNDQKRLNKLVGELTGCEGCHSGFSIEFVTAWQYRINPSNERLEAY
jgi:hypothetical protein